jgi:REP element-mobilizing transposase RayT
MNLSYRTSRLRQSINVTDERTWGGLLHAFVIMSNHFHLALETPLENLVAGRMHLASRSIV